MPAWWVTKDGDLDCLDMHSRHYSRYEYADQRERKLFVGPGGKLVLRTERADACFVWRKFTDDCIDERTGEQQQGVNCAVFRNESQHLSSSLIRQADAIADEAWTDSRHYTYVNSEKVASANPGYCFLMAGWRRCGVTKGGLLIFERLAEWSAEGANGPEANRLPDGAEATGQHEQKPGYRGTRQGGEMSAGERVCASGLQEHTLCGDAPEASEVVDAPPFRFAKPGEKITCEGCRRVLHWTRLFSQRSSWFYAPKEQP